MKLVRSEDALIAGLFFAFCVATSFANPDFLSLGTAFDLLRSSIVIGMLAVGVFVVLVSGGLDLSFTAVAALAMYVAVKTVIAFGLGANLFFVFAIAMVTGTFLGLINAFFIGTLRLPTLIVTLGTLTVFRGFLLTFVGTTLIPTLPAGMRTFARSTLVTVDASDGSSYSLPTAFLCLVAVAAVTWILLNRTTLGRSIFALGGSLTSAERLGIRVAAVQYFIYGFVGMIAGAAGVVHAAMSRVANPFDLVGLELSVIAAVVLGGARITGGHGSLLGTLLGVGLVSVMNNSLIMWGIPSTWQNVVLGLLILVGTGASALRARTKALAP